MYEPVSKEGAPQCEVHGPETGNKWPLISGRPQHYLLFGNMFDIVCCEVCEVKVTRLIQDNIDCPEIVEFSEAYEEVMHFRNGGDSDFTHSELSRLYIKASKRVREKIKELINEHLSTNKQDSNSATQTP